MGEIYLKHLPWGSETFDWGKRSIQEGHYLHKMPDPRTSFEMYAICSQLCGVMGFMVFGRPQNSRFEHWFGTLRDWESGRCEVTNWQVLNLSRVYIAPGFQIGGPYCKPEFVPGFIDRKGVYRSTLATAAIAAAVRMIGADYLVHRPPVNLEEPYEIHWLLSNCDLHKHRGIIYRQAGMEFYGMNEDWVQTWRIRLPGLSPEEDRKIREAVQRNPRSLRFWAKRAQQVLF